MVDPARLVLLAMVLGCARERVRPDGTATADLEILDGSASMVVLASGWRLLSADSAGVTLLDPRQSGVVSLGLATPSALLAATVGDGMVVLVDSDVGWWDGTQLMTSPITGLLPEAVWSVSGGEAALWIESSEGIMVWFDGVIGFPAVDDGRLAGPIQAGAMVGDTPAAWAVLGNDLVALTEDGQELLAVGPRAPDALALDGSGRLWAARGRKIERRDASGLWTTLVFSDPVVSVFSDPSSPATWVKTEDQELLFSDEAWLDVSLPQGDWVGVDAGGGLVLLTDEGVVRASVDRPLGLLDMPQRLSGEATVTVAPTLPEAVSSVTVEINAVSVQTLANPWQFVMDAGVLASGLATVDVSVLYDDGATVNRSLDVDVVTADVSWADDIQPLFASRCSDCHSGKTETVLDTAAQWEANVEEILVQVESSAMPLGEQPLTSNEIGLIQSWRDGGFP